MVALPQTFKTADLPDTGGKTVHIPEGQYQAVIVESTLEDTSNKSGKFLKLKLVITQGQYANTELFERLNVVNPNQQAVEIAYKTLARISEAVGMDTTPSDSNQLHNKPLLITVETEKGTPWKDKDGVERQGKDKSVIKKYHPLPKTGVASGGFAQPAASVAPQAAASGSTPPWAK